MQKRRSRVFLGRVCVLGAAAALAVASLGGCAVRAWDRARSDDTAAAYHRFLRDHPGSRYAPLAEERLAYQQLRRAPSIAGLEAFRREHPQSEYLDELSALLEEPLFEAARAAGTAEAYAAFLERYPSGRLSARAQGNAAYLRERGFESGLEELARFVREHPESDFADEAARSLALPAIREDSRIEAVELHIRIDPRTPGGDQLADAFSKYAARAYRAARIPLVRAGAGGGRATARLVIQHREADAVTGVEAGRVAGGILATTQVTLLRDGADAPTWSETFTFRADQLDRRPGRSILFDARAQRYWARFFVPVARWRTDAARRPPLALSRQAVAVDAVGDRAVVLFEDGSFEVVDLSDPTRPQRVAQYARAGDLSKWSGVRATGSHVLLFGQEGVEIVELGAGGARRVAALGRDRVGSIEAVAVREGEIVIGGTRGLFRIPPALDGVEPLLASPVHGVAWLDEALLFIDDAALHVSSRAALRQGRALGSLRLGRVVGPARIRTTSAEADVLVNGRYLRIDLREPGRPAIRSQMRLAESGVVRDVARIGSRIFLLGDRGLLLLDPRGERVVDSVDVTPRAGLDDAGRHLVVVEGGQMQVVDATGFVATVRPAAAAPQTRPLR